MKLKKSIKKNRYKVAGTSGLGLSAAAIIWLYKTFVPVHQYDNDLHRLEVENGKIWNAIHQTNPNAK